MFMFQEAEVETDRKFNRSNAVLTVVFVAGAAAIVALYFSDSINFRCSEVPNQTGCVDMTGSNST